MAGSHGEDRAGRGRLLAALDRRAGEVDRGQHDDPHRVRRPARSGVRARRRNGIAGRGRDPRRGQGRRYGPDRRGLRGPERGTLMRVAIAGAGAVGRSIASELLENGHEVLLIDHDPKAIAVESVPRAEWLLADACEISSLDDAQLYRCNEWLYNESWGVDVAISTPRLLSALVEEAVSVGDLVRLMTFGQSEASLVELTMPSDAPLAGQQVGSIEWPSDAALVAILREGRVLVPQPDDPLQGGDELFFVTTEDVEDQLERLFSAG